MAAKRGMKIIMSNFNDDSSKESLEMEKWLTKLFLDPLTEQLDETTFHIDIFETYEDYIIEALLNNYRRQDISVYLDDKRVAICAAAMETAAKKRRVIEFPFPVTKRKVSAYFKNGILEIYISKEPWKCGKSRKVPVL